MSFLLLSDLEGKRKVTIFLKISTKLPFHCLCTIVSVFRASPLEHVCVHHAVSARVAAARVLDLHVLVLHIGIKGLQLAQLQKVCCKQSECLQAAMKQTRQQKNTMYEQCKTKESELCCFHFNGRSGCTNGKLGYCVVP